MSLQLVHEGLAFSFMFDLSCNIVGIVIQGPAYHMQQKRHLKSFENGEASIFFFAHRNIISLNMCRNSCSQLISYSSDF